MKLIVGLGNPGDEYENTRHNIGFMILDNYLNKVSWQKKFNTLYLEKVIAGEKIIFIKPQTYMNNSGLAVRKIFDYFNINIQDLLIIQDDLDIEFGKYKLKKESSSGGHNGLKSIIEHLNSDSFARLKIGIKNGKSEDTINYVLGSLKRSEKNQIIKLQPIFNEIIESFIQEGIEKTMNVYNRT